MHEIVEAIVLGLVQGLTEFLPVSSSGHLEIAKFIFGENWIAEESLLMTIILHFATALSTIVVFRKEIAEITIGFFSKSDSQYRLFVGFIVLSMIPAGLVGLLFQDVIVSFFADNILLVSCMLLVTACLLYIGDTTRITDRNVTGWRAFIIGIAQAVAILPGISRSGTTIAVSLMLKIDREKAAKFSFLMVLPLIIGKMLVDVSDGTLRDSSLNGGALIGGFIMAFISGLLACKWMIAIVKRAKLKYFSLYCLAVGLTGITYVAFFT
ncbi:MAG TPA: undecaprenyl-diphosphate phosphatase [Saprospiraceae bacterium]|mgnify:FL=1|nr:undecaprenyl-diphosphate phosphatase [Saprospiraceae bacterium]